LEFRVEPEACVVDSPVQVQVTAWLDRPLGAGEVIAFAMPESWSSQPYCITYTKFAQVEDAHKPDYLSVSSEGVEFELSFESVLLPSGVNKVHIRKLVAKVVGGEVDEGGQVTLELRNSTSAWLAESAAIRVWVGDEEVAEPPRLLTLPEEAERVRLIVPSSGRPGEPFPVCVVSLDRYWNLSASTFSEGVLSVEYGAELERGICFTGSYETEASLEEEGVYRLLYDGIRSNPVRIATEADGPFWGDIHSHDKFHNCGAGEHPHAYARNVARLDFVGVVPDFRGLSQQTFPAHAERVNRANDPPRFTTLLGYEVGFREGHHNVYFREGDGQIFETGNSELWSMEKLLPELDPKEVVVVPHHAGIHWCPQKGYRPERDDWMPLLEIYSSHGLSEQYMPEHILSYEFNRVRGENKYASSIDRPVYARDAWAQGRRFGVVASSDDHMGQPGKPIKGCVAVRAGENRREAIWDSLKERRTYATTGERMLIDLAINGHGMGAEFAAKRGEKLEIDFEVYGTDQLAIVEVVRYRFEGDVWERAFFVELQDHNPFHEG